MQALRRQCAGGIGSGGSQAARSRSSFSDHWPLVVCLFSYLVVAVLYGATIPIFETPDANGHYAYIHELTEGRGLPVQGEPSGRRVTGYVASHPPLYYALCAALTFWVPDDVDFDDWAWWNPYQTMGDASRPVNKNILVHTPAERFPWSGTPLTMHIARFISALLGALTLVATYGTTRELFPEQRWLALGATTLAGFTPMFVFTSARVSNDAAVTAFGSLAVWGAVRLAVRGLSRKGLVLTGAALGLAVLSKLSGAVLAPAVALALLFHSLRTWREHSGLPALQRLVMVTGHWAWVGLTALVVCGWWFVRNAVLYGEWAGVSAWLSHTATVRAEPIGVFRVIPELRGLEKSYWAMFGWFNVAAAPWMYRFWWVLVRLAFIGLGLLTLDQRKGGEPSPRRLRRPVQWGLLTLASAFLFNLGFVWRFIMIVLGAQGRYLMPAVGPISILLMMGLGRIVPQGLPRAQSRGSSPYRRLQGLAGAVGLIHLALALGCLVLFILPAYAKPEAVAETSLPEDMVRLDLSFDGTPIMLLGGHIEAEGAKAGDSVPLSLYWQATQPPREGYFAFVQVLGREMEPIAGVDCYPGRGTFPPTLWTPGVIYRDRYHLPIAAGAEVPTAGLLHAGLRTEDRRRLPASRLADPKPAPSAVEGPVPNQPPLELAILDRTAVRPRAPVSDDVDHPTDARVGESITLVGYDVSAERVRRGGTLTVTLVWRAHGPLTTDYTAFVHLVDAEGDLVSQSDHPPLGGAYPTSLWDAGDVVRDSHGLEIDDKSAPGACTLLTGLYNSSTGDRLPAYRGEDGGRFKDDVIVAGGVIIE